MKPCFVHLNTIQQLNDYMTSVGDVKIPSSERKFYKLSVRATVTMTVKLQVVRMKKCTSRKTETNVLIQTKKTA